MTRLASDLLGVPADMIVYAQGETDLLPTGRGNGGSAATVVGVTAVKIALDDFIADGGGIAAAALGCGAGDLAYGDGAFLAPDGQKRHGLISSTTATKQAATAFWRNSPRMM